MTVGAGGRGPSGCFRFDVEVPHLPPHRVDGHLSKLSEIVPVDDTLVPDGGFLVIGQSELRDARWREQGVLRRDREPVGLTADEEIGRASCRERVCQYV